MLLNTPGRSATVLVALALSGERPAATSAGKVSSVPPPAIALTNPPSRAAPAPTRNWAAVTGGAEGMTIGGLVEPGDRTVRAADGAGDSNDKGACSHRALAGNAGF